MRTLKQISLLFILTVSFVACNDEEPDTVGPITEITNIPDNKEYKFGENLVMHFKFTDQTGMYEYKYEIYAKDFTNQSFTYEKHIEFETYYTELKEAQSISLPEKSPSEIYQEGEYLIKVQASDINQRVSTYYKPIKITYPVE